MIQKEYKDIIEAAFDKYYSGESETTKEQIEILEEAIRYCRLFREEHGKDYRYKFFGKWIDLREVLLKEMDLMIERAKNIENENAIEL